MIPEKFIHILEQFSASYLDAIAHQHGDLEQAQAILNQYFSLISQQMASPFAFQPYHEGIRSPFDYYAFGLDLIRPLILFNESKVWGLDHVKQMEQQLTRNENVILFGNHQIEPDPQIIGLLLEKTHPQFASSIIFVAGDRVTTDPLAVPLSMGCNLLCIYSKKRIDHPPELKQEKQLHNQRTMKMMSQLLAEGGKAIYVAPSGGRDRADDQGNVDVAPFDAQSIEMFYLMAKQSEKPTHFYPLALSTYYLLPPPQSLDTSLGEKRETKCHPAHLAFGSEIDMEHFPGSNDPDKKERRKHRAEAIWKQVKQDYNNLLKDGH